MAGELIKKRINWSTWDHAFYRQDVIICLPKGEQIADTYDCPVIDGPDNKGIVCYPNYIYLNKKTYKMFKFSDKQDVLFYK